MKFQLAEALSRKNLRWRSFLCLLALLFVIPQGWISAWAWERDLRWLYLLLISFFVSSLLVPFAVYLSVRFLVLDMPAPRKMHSAATPRLGGLAVYGAVVLTLLRNYKWSGELLWLLAGGSLIYGVGVWEDSKGLSAGARLVGQALAAGIAIAGGLCVSFVPHIPGERLWEILFTVVWLVGITNAINCLDGIDGLAVGLGTLCSLLVLAIAWPTRQGHLAYAASALAGACLGFIPYNWNPAKIFLGDAGATFIGFMLAGLTVMGSWAVGDPVVALSTPVLILGIPIFDMTYTTLARVRRGAVRTLKEWLEFVGRDHFHHRLIKLGMNTSEAVGFILLVNCCLGLGALVIRYTVSGFGSILLLVQTVLIFAIIVVLMLLGREISLE
ncbi:MAG: undecaprenyl/decaprenyl-phosphate alpha-N-acetylglucosaminyl 1-phosphate transferase [Elusimicrobia bacterium]|nr:undecaprenyl/decaprenyl-phosphate alpha-N-acetylglucosaminyl 1-phosphate transferase [Elusimicrobiota bacterium]